MDLMEMATSMLGAKLGGSADNNSNELIQSVIGNLMGGSGGQGIDLGSIVGNLQNSGLGDLAASWLGDGNNEGISSSQLESVFGSDKIAQAAQQLGTDQSEVLKGLQDMLPQLVDKSSSGGSLLDSVGGLGGLASMASKFLK
ncbi:YidB family protein [Arenicella xantha]|uniref:Uncharacterized protein YidB (DUF937 family) n=1 Tax=Arenicella xantha TaxID=644221 RepID=A0A395JPE6_9GAMM|nr:YidB family protein [Arenicella xantha]RBP51444.1 uncharacterized protein YidB (DUF937 family) [Arenicella xantha]